MHLRCQGTFTGNRASQLSRQLIQTFHHWRRTGSTEHSSDIISSFPLSFQHLHPRKAWTRIDRVYPPIHPSTHPPIHPPTHPPIHPSIHRCVCVCVCRAIFVLVMTVTTVALSYTFYGSGSSAGQGALARGQERSEKIF